MATRKVEVNKFKKRRGAFKNKIGNRDNGRPVRSIPDKELVSIMENLTNGGDLYKRDRNKIAIELKRRGLVT